MYAVGRLGSYITRGVYTVSGPFHPFGGAVDIVVVQQPDGSLKSSPWYVRFGKFQGVLKAKEKIVDINVNGVDANFNMYLDPRGEAYFLREVDSEEVVDAISAPSSPDEEIDVHLPDKTPLKSKSMEYTKFDPCDPVIGVSNGKVLSRNNSRRSRILGFVLGRKSLQERSLSREEADSNAAGRIASLEHAEIAADLLEMKWSTNISRRNNKECREGGTDGGEITGGRLEAGLVLHEEHFVNRPNNSPLTEVVEETVVADVDGTGIEEHGSLRIGSGDSVEAAEPLEVVAEVASSEHGDAAVVAESCSVAEVPDGDEERTAPVLLHEANADAVSATGAPDVFVEQFSFSDMDLNRTPSEVDVNPAGSESTSPKYVTDSSPGDGFKSNRERVKGIIRRFPSDVDIRRSCDVMEHEIERQAKSLPNMWTQFDEPDTNDYDDSPFYSPVARFRSKWDTLRDDSSRILKGDLEKGLQLSDSPRTDLSKDLKEGDLPNIGSGGSWSLWPFRRSRSSQVSQEEPIGKKDCDVDVGLETDGEKDGSSPNSSTMNTRALTPTPEQLASLNLKEGKNTVTFTFSTSVLGPQQVDARIYLWRWDTRIVISDVDGTITKSDVLGQFMPLVGRDWSHIGVAHLFSAIKENGYQLLFLSARAISQAYITRQFLFNLKQDGKALPDGPVVISPDGLFPSLFREVIRRAPHEFKIACLEDIKACFPPDRNPFYAGFGNRDTDEFSYLKVGIPKGKIFIINPKGEVVVNRCIDSKSYTSLHSLVNGMFPPISMHEEEDFNSWNFWKLPPPTID